MASERKLTVVIAGDAKGATSALSAVQGAADLSGTKFLKMGLTAAAALAGAGAAVVGFGKQVFEQAEQSELVMKQTEAVLRSTGDAAGLSAKQIADLSTKLSEQSGIDDELIQSGENILLTFRNVRNEAGAGNDIFSQATQTALDMSVAMGTDLKSANIQLGKALNDPIKGITALTRVGVTFTDQQKDQIKKLVESGDTLGAQKIILRELTSEFGGSAKSQATSSDKMKVAWNNMEEELGTALLPTFNKVVDGATKLLEKFTALPGPVKAGLLAVTGLAGGLLAANKAVSLWKSATEAGTAVQKLATAAQWEFNAAMDANPIMLVVLALGALVAGLVIAYEKVGWFRDLVNAAFNGIKDVVGGVVNFIRDHWQLLVEILTGPIGIAVGLITSHWDTIKNGFTAVKDWIGNRINDIVGFFTALPGRVMGFVTTIWDGIKTGITGAKNWIHDRIEDVVGFVTGLPGRISKAAHGMWDGIKDAFRSAINFIIRGWNSLHFHVPGFSAFGHKIGGFDLGLPPIHELATGGIIRATAGGVFARIGEAGSNEAVIPLNPQGLRPVVDAAIEGFEQYLSSLRGSVGSPVASPQGPMVVQLVMDGVKVGEVLLSNLEQRLKRNGPGVLQLSL